MREKWGIERPMRQFLDVYDRLKPGGSNPGTSENVVSVNAEEREVTCRS